MAPGLPRSRGSPVSAARDSVRPPALHFNMRRLPAIADHKELLVAARRLAGTIWIPGATT